MTAGASGGAAAGIGGGAIGGDGGRAGTGGGATAGTGGAGLDPVQLVIFYTRWGTAYPGSLPTGSERSFTLSAVYRLEPHKSELILLSGLTNASVYLQGRRRAASSERPTPATI